MKTSIFETNPISITMKTLFAFFFLFLSFELLSQADPFNPQQSGTLITSAFPAFSGWHGGLQVASTGDFRLYDAGPQLSTYNITADGYIHPIRSSINMRYTNDRLGSTKYDVLAVNYTARLKLGKETWLLPTIGYARNRYKVEPNWRSNTSPWIDPKVQSQGFSSRTNQIHGGLGIVSGPWLASLQYAGNVNFDFPAQQSNRPWQYGYSIPHKLSGVVIRNINIKDFVFSPVMLVSTDFRPSLRLSFGSNLQYKWLFAGVRYELYDRAFLALGFEVSNSVRLGYSYAITTSRIANGSTGDHEIGLRIILPSRSPHRIVPNIGLL